MRPTHKNRSRNNRHRSSGGGGGGNTGGNPLSRVYDSNGPDVKVRGTAQTIADKYLQLGRDAQSAGDIVMAESYFQHAEHYLRIVSAAQAYNQQSAQQYRRPDDEFDDEELEGQSEQPQPDLRGSQNSEPPEGMGEQPAEGDRQAQPQQQNYRQQRDYRDNREQGQRDQSQQRDQNGQPYQPRERYNKPRWQDRRDQPQQQGGEARPVPHPQRHEEQPRTVEAAPPLAASPPPAEADPKWEAPSFLRRPAPAPVPETVADVVASEAAMPVPAPAKRAYNRKPKLVAPALPDDAPGGNAAPEPTPAGD